MALPASDNFNRADGGLGANWTTVTGENAPAISSNNVGPGSSGTNYGAYWSADTFGNDHWAEIVLATTPVGNGGCGPRVRQASGANSSYLLWIDFALSGQLTMYRISSGSFSALGANYSAVSNGDTVRVEVSGTTLTPYVNGSPLATRTDSTHTSGSAGIRYRDTSPQLDDFGADDVGGGGPTGQPMRKRLGGIPYNGFQSAGMW